MTTFQIWSGIETIGGNIAEISTHQARVICDFGLSGGANKDQPLENLTDLESTLVEGKLPQIPGLFDTSDFQTIQLAGVESQELKQAIFVSHLHIDHMGGLKFLPAEVEVYLTKDSLTLYEALIEVGDEVAPVAKLHGVDYGEVVRIGDIQVFFQESDHDIKGIASIFIQTPEAKFVHTGDFRLTGYHPEKVDQLVEAINQFEPDYVFIEGTSFSFDVEEDRITSEANLLDNFKKGLTEYANDLIVFNPYMRNVERIHYFNQAAKAMGRQMVLEPTYANVYQAFYPDADFLILSEDRSNGVGYSLENRPRYINLKLLKKDPELYLLQNAFENISILADLKPAIYLHTNGEPIGEYMPAYSRMIAYLKSIDIPFVSFGVSGHASQTDLLNIANRIRTQNIIPWHTFKPHYYGKLIANLGLHVVYPKYKKSYIV